MASLRIANRTFNSRLLTGTGKYASADQLRSVLEACGSEIVTVAIKRVQLGTKDDGIISALQFPKTFNFAQHFRRAHSTRSYISSGINSRGLGYLLVEIRDSS
jgi:hypothetical protein